MSNAAAELVTENTDNPIAEFSPFEAQLAEFRQRYAGAVYDLSDAAQEKQARSDRLAIGKVISKLDSVHKDVKAPLKEKIDLLDGERKRIKDDLRGIQDGIKNQIAEHEQKIQARKAALLERVEDIKRLSVFPAPQSVFVLETVLESAKAITIDDSFEEFEADAALAKMRAIESLENALTEAKEREAEEAEQKRLAAEKEAAEQKAREEAAAQAAKEEAERIAAQQIEAERQQREQAEREAAEKLEAERLAKEKAEQEHKEAEARAARELEEAKAQAEREKQAAIDAERQKAEQLEAARIAEEKRIAEEQAAKEADQKYREACWNSASEALVNHCDLTPVQAVAVLRMVDEKRIPYVAMQY